MMASKFFEMDEIVPSKLKPLSLVFAQNNKITSTAIKAENIFLFFRTLFVQRSPLMKLLLRRLKVNVQKLTICDRNQSNSRLGSC